jgi:hypothetical protein
MPCVGSGWPSKTTPFSLSEEFSIDSPEGRDRDYFLGLLLAKRWHPCGGTEHWDLEFHGTRVLMATERGEGTAKRTLVRVQGAATSEIAGLLGQDPLPSGKPMTRIADNKLNIPS